ncbi:MAG: TonB-dependent receptor [Pseudomonadota bacterium]
MRKTLFLAGAGLSSLMAAGPLSAQATDTALTETDSSDAAIVVTAQKREQALSDIPGSVTAVGEETLNLTGAGSVQDIVALAPGLSFDQHNGGTFVTLRGVGLEVDTGVAEPNVAIHVDGVFLPRTTMATLDFADLQRVEILRGPQGTLYGRNATGGAINFIARPPADIFEGQVSAGFGAFETYHLRGALSGPLSDGIRARISAAYDRRADGYVDNVFTGDDFDRMERFNIRGALAFDLAPNLSVEFAAQYQEETFETYQQILLPPGPAGPFIFPQLATAVAPIAPWTVGNDFNPESERSTFMGRATIEWDASADISVRSITGYIDHQFTNNLDGDGTSAALITVENRTQPSEAFSQEFNLFGTIADNIDWLVGLYYFHEDFTSSIPVGLPSGAAALMIPPGAFLLSEIDETTESIAGFADVTFNVSDRFRLFGGVRIARDEKDFVQNAGALIPRVPPALTLTCQDLNLSRTFESTSPRFGAQFDASDAVMIYGQYQRGFKSGGLNSSTCGDEYEPEEIDAFEIGLKADFADGRSFIRASLFDYDYSGLQLFKIILVNAQIENADARVRGAEVELGLAIDDIWRVDLSGTFLDAEYRNFEDFDPANPALGLQDLEGNRLSRAPDVLINAAIQGDIPIELGPFDRLRLRADARYSSEFFFRPFNTPQDRQDDYVIVNLTVALASSEAGPTVRAFVRNLTDADVIGHLFYNQLTDSYLGNYNPPRTWGIEASFSF